MEIKKLTIHNVASIADAEIDFCGEMLGNAPVFLICGETGAGKSTILDAICLALYGNTPRMNSVAKEELELSDADARNRYYTNDNSQLLRRGTGEGFCRLLFAGNDGKDYEAFWEVHRNHDKPEKRLQRPRRSLRAVDNSFSEHRIAEIDIKIEEVTGLQYEQFCRTVMLAQGEFTKFLKSRKEEKSEILEKLTGTEIYSRIGMLIAEKFNSRKAAWLALKRDVENVRFLNEEELTSYASQLESLGKDVEILTKERDVLMKKSEWLTTSATLQAQLSKVMTEKAAIIAVIASDEFKEKTKEMERYDITSESRRLLKERTATDSVLKKKKSLLPAIEEKHRKALEEETVVGKKVKEMNESISKTQAELEKYDFVGLSNSLNDAMENEKLIDGIISETDKLRNAEDTVKVFRNNMSEYEKERGEAQTCIVSLETPIKYTEEELERYNVALSHGEKSVSDTVKDIRGSLKIGDNCPVCGSEIKELLSNERFESILLPIREGKKGAEDRLVALKSDLKSKQGIIAEAEKRIHKYKGDIETWSKKIVEISDNLSLLVKRSGIEQDSEDIIRECEKRKEELKASIYEIREAQSRGTEKQKELSLLQKKNKEINDEYLKCKDKTAKAFSAIEIHKGDIASTESKFRELSEALGEAISTIEGIDFKELERLAALDAGYIATIRDEVTRSLDIKKEMEVRCSTLSEQLGSHEARRPELDENDTTEMLKTQLDDVNEKVREKERDTGRISEVLANDKRLRDDFSEKVKALESAREDVDLWEGLYNRLGDQKGAKFRAIAQSFILQSLLESANIYMTNFTDRYTLTCNPGTLAILVRDNYKPSDPQPATILSGGESFMASLSLALALANLRSGGMGADVLFIDEGFGTLSPEYLGNVMDTLEKLHQMGGRKVGLISHVAEMKERIPVHISVTRESPALSHVKITTEY